MKSSRLEAFSDGVLAIIITIMILELKVPYGDEFSALKPLLPKFLAYILSFLYVGIYWNNHHHLFQIIEKINGKVLWANLGLLFFLSLIPFTTDWMGKNHFGKNPVAVYGLVLLCAAVSYMILAKFSFAAGQENKKLKEALSDQRKEYLSVLLYMAGIGCSFFYPYISVGIYWVVALMWMIPDSRIEKRIS